MCKLRATAALCLLAGMTAAAAPLPRPAPDLAINLAVNKQVRLSQYRGKTVVLAFILTYCSHCQAVVRGLIKDQEELGPKGLQVVACAIEDVAATAVPGFVRQFAPNFPVGYNTSAEAVKFLQHPPMMGFFMPALVFIDKNGVIRAQYEGRDDMLKESVQEKNVRDKILEMMNQGAPATPGKAPGKKGAGKKG
ncbi:MAG: TlpA family protein disulfide reductase [Acidobacteria bacterium]|nr:TlpA family protein disulfide reductase [Acidobacteriota bacterium]